MQLAVPALLAAALGVAAPAEAATLTVNTTADAVDAAPGDGDCASAGGSCSLRAAIMEANALPGPDVIVVSAGHYALALAGTDESAATTGDLDVHDELTITGAGASSTVVDGGGIDRVFDNFGMLRLNDLTVVGGLVVAEFPAGGGGIAATRHQATDTFFRHSGFLQPVARADLALSAKAPASVAPGEDLPVTFTVANKGPSFATEVSIDVFRSQPRRMVLVPELSPGCSTVGTAGVRIVCKLSDMAPETSRTAAMVFRLGPGAGPNLSVVGGVSEIATIRMGPTTRP